LSHPDACPILLSLSSRAKFHGALTVPQAEGDKQQMDRVAEKHRQGRDISQGFHRLNANFDGCYNTGLTFGTTFIYYYYAILNRFRNISGAQRQESFQRD
jgi:hypothetical protein